MVKFDSNPIFNHLLWVISYFISIDKCHHMMVTRVEDHISIVWSSWHTLDSLRVLFESLEDQNVLGSGTPIQSNEILAKKTDYLILGMHIWKLAYIRSNLSIKDRRSLLDWERFGVNTLLNLPYITYFIFCLILF
jgi:hypothetical protein